MRRIKDKIEGTITNADYASSAGSASTATTAAKLGRGGATSTPMVFNWSGQSGQPTWLWGGNDGTNMYVYNPSNFNVNYAKSAGAVAWGNVSDKPTTFAPSAHTHPYAGSSSAGGSANSAVKLDTTTAGSATQPVYFKDGKPTACSYTLNKSVPADAKFTDTNTWRGIQNNLTSDSTTDSLSAAQGKALKTLVDGKANVSHTHSYLPLSGGTVTGRIVRNGGGSWISDRNNVAVFGNYSAKDNYNPVVGQKTPNGAWTMGNLANSESLIFNYSTDANYNSGSNNTTQVYLPAQGGTIITSATIGSQSVNYAKSAGAVAWGNVSGKPSTFTPASHTHNYAGSSSAGGSATSAVKLDTSTAGSATQPVYFKDGKPTACTYTLGKSVPADAKFTDTNTWRGIQNNLTSTSTTDSLSAAQGKALNDKITNLQNRLNCTLVVNTDTSTSVTVSLGSTSYTASTSSSSKSVSFTLSQLGTWTVKVTKNGVVGTDTVAVTQLGMTYTISVIPLSTILNQNNWTTIKQQSDAGTATNYWKVGDTKTITISGTVAGVAFNRSVNVFIAEFNHNASREGSNRIHFLIGRSDTDSSKLLGLAANYGGSSSGFMMNNSNTSSGGWSSSYMRNTILGQSPNSPTSGSLMAALPSDLRSVMKSVNKYTNNSSSSTASVTATTDYLFLMSEYEANGTNYSSAAAEKSYQTQYEYFRAGNTIATQRSDNQSLTGVVWTRSPMSGSTAYFTSLNNGVSIDSPTKSYLVVAGFCV